MDHTFPPSARGSTGPLSMSGNNICALSTSECYLEVRGSPAPVNNISYLPNASDRLCVPQLPHRLSLWVTKDPEPGIKSPVAFNLWSVFDDTGSVTLALMLDLVLRSG